MNFTTKFVGLDVSKATIAVAIADAGQGPTRYLGAIENTPEAVRKLVKRLGRPEDLVMCYEAGPTGYGLHRHLTELGVKCFVVAPSLTPTRPGDQVKTDRRDALRLAQLLRAGELTPVWVPGEEDEALRDLVRARGFAKGDLRRARQRVASFLLRHGVELPQGTKRWSVTFLRWLDKVSFTHRPTQIAWQEYLHAEREAARRVERLEAEIHAWAKDSIHTPVIQALQALRGVREITAVSLVAEVGQFSRFKNPAQLMAYSGVVPREYSSGSRTRRGGISKTGNSNVRFVLGEAAWAYRFKPAVKEELRKRQEGLDPEILHISMKAQQRLHRKYCDLLRRGKHSTVAVTAVSRELIGFIWAIACHAESKGRTIAAA